ncbi:uncharacterized protein PHALS_06185 [Plasmopara halstedii]|uniref:Uncharacterized protein n=1 Tax=Plasmopara halstedii TaxID=4781 RepID=A0A0P1B2T0_PLAHL|nr:uncharacterized protein PHALS_06185 [Plasmopara halstedii]CEG48359.1 hypothetical protein PHALS_06185 [Plasmopara halstedii]|eukprot:XP_024584728.1 hypothetical protein PHALS_06185 [Plasmopara halstedii]
MYQVMVHGVGGAYIQDDVCQRRFPDGPWDMLMNTHLGNVIIQLPLSDLQTGEHTRWQNSFLAGKNAIKIISENCCQDLKHPDDIALILYA